MEMHLLAKEQTCYTNKNGIADLIVPNLPFESKCSGEKVERCKGQAG
jgi:hypothetical protein